MRQLRAWLKKYGFVTTLWIVLGAPIALTLLAPGQPPMEAGGRASGYSRIIEEVFVKRNWLVAHDYSGDPAADQSGDPVVTISGKVRSELTPFYRRSFLRQDVQADDRTLWRFRGERVVGVAPGTHGGPGPYDAVIPWTGDIVFREGSRRELSLVSPEGGRLILMPPQTIGAPPDLSLNPNSARTTEGASPFIRFVHEGREAAAVQVIGEAAAVSLKAGSTLQVCIDGQPVQAGSAAIVYARLDLGRSLQFGAGCDGPSWRLQVRQVAISHYRAGTPREREPTTVTLAGPVEAAMPSLDLDSRRACVRTSLDLDLHRQVQDKLTTVARTMIPKGGDWLAFRAAALVMDAQTGEVLALGSFPFEREDMPRSDRFTPLAESLLSRNHNFTTLPIGSVAKIPFSAAILQDSPNLRFLRIEPATEGGGQRVFTDVLGLKLTRSIKEESGAPNPDFAAFISTSSNQYAASLIVLAAAAGDPTVPDGLPMPGRRYWIGEPGGGTERRSLPKLTLSLTPRRDGFYQAGFPAGDPTSQWGWTGELDALFDIKGVSQTRDISLEDDGGVGLNDYDLGPWAGLPGNIGGPALRPLVAVSPERERFHLAAAQDLRNDYIQLILGGARSRWTTVKVAEVFSRLATDLKVKASLTADPPRTKEALKMDPAVRATMLNAMAQTVATGTAKRLQAAQSELQALVPGETVLIYAKTGTPTLEAWRRSPANRAVAALIDLGMLELRGGRLVPPRRGDQNLTLREALGDDVRAMEEITARGLTLAGIEAQVRRINRDPAGQLLTANGRLTGIKPDIGFLDEEGKVIGLTVVRLGPDGRLIRAVTVVANLQRYNNTPVHLMTAEAILKSDAFKRVFLTLPKANPDAAAC